MQNHIRQLREARGLTLEQLAEAVGTSNQQISLLELNKRQLTVSWMVRLAKVLGCHPWTLVEGDLDLELLIRLSALSDEAKARLLASLDDSGSGARRSA